MENTPPKREILAPPDMPKWIKSKAYNDYLNFVLELNKSVKSKSMKNVTKESETIKKLLELIDRLNTWIDQIPPHDQPQRFGNKAYRDWHKKLIDESESLIEHVIGNDQKCSILELKPYLTDSFGNSTRIDYGTGHEACFITFLLCLHKLNQITTEDFEATINRVFEKYLRLCRKLQIVYRMEPAGSHGVWCLDDYQFLPFLFGSSQLIDNPQIDPSRFVTEGFAEKYSDEFMFMGCIEFINQVKRGPFAEHSNQLWNISAVPTWSKINSGLINMYKNEVLAKFPVVQHFVFGNLFTIEPTS